MSTAGDNSSKKARREAAREHARAMREREQQRRRRNRLFLQGGIGLAVLAVAAIVVLVVVNSIQPAGPGPKNMASDGILLHGNGKSITAVTTGATKAGAEPTATKTAAHKDTINVVIYEDYMCPYCNQFETTNMTQIKQWVTAGYATLELHPFALLDASSLGTKYSTRATNAAACVANYEPNKFLAVNQRFYKKQPSEQTKGLTDDQIVSLVKAAGATNENIPSCIHNGTFKGWVADVTNRTLNDKIPNSDVKKLTGTPLVLVNGQQYTGSLTDTSAFSSFVEQVAEQAVGSSGSSTATPTATPSAG
ncbi:MULTISPECIES: thioredoxin domain-containing protein [unclassified Curtobacterium]|uniref:DsbA family protein n=1 Tax=unclassified Curtobacterium TaxID=257496 RepID=UPI000DA95FF1|nr:MULTISPECIES: thioredoxin domain-containing protein [unclassified Curtobacterium]PZE24018.1 hypothetical protein DEI86_13340 [Curtobacterium sp. MCBD17_028]PZE73605.1 hypothetical protein DEI82_13390 [Curtobacterium sp. MCBD17_019]WIB64412.1 thioredoxin domain-containing protein [Curtobacterium sp. MCBD17_040]